MIQLISNKSLEKIVDSTNIEWGIKASLKDAKFSKFLPYADQQESILYFPPKFAFNLLLYQIILNNHDTRFSGNQLLNLKEMIAGALKVYDLESAEELKQKYCEKLKDFYREVSNVGNLDYNINNSLLFILFHELTHVRIAQQPSFLELKREELSQRISKARLFVRILMKINLKKVSGLEEEVICDLEACKKLRESLKSKTEIKDTLLDIVHTIDILNNIGNLRDAYVRNKESMLKKYFKLTHSTDTNRSIARYLFIQNFWKDDLILSGMELLNGSISSSLSLSLTQETIDFCKEEFQPKFVTFDRLRTKEIEKEIYEAEQSFIDSLMTLSKSL